MKKIISIIGLFLFMASVNAQSPVGKWKLVKGITQSKHGIITDVLKEDYQKQPCLANVIYSLTADGKIITDADHCPDSTKKDLGVANLGIRWERPDYYNIIITTDDKDLEPLNYALTFCLNPDTRARCMIWILHLKYDPYLDSGKPDEIAQLVFTFHEL